jgi:hypothetical protein
VAAVVVPKSSKPLPSSAAIPSHTPLVREFLDALPRAPETTATPQLLPARLLAAASTLRQTAALLAATLALAAVVVPARGATPTHPARALQPQPVVTAEHQAAAQVARAVVAPTPAQHQAEADREAQEAIPTTQAQVRRAASPSRTPEMDKKIPVAMLDGSCVWVDSKDAAALAGLSKLPYGRKEFAGAIYQREDGKFCYSDAVPGTMDNFEFATDPKAGKFAGLYHTHHGGQESEFSPTDVKVADALRKTSYIRGNESGDVRRYDPGVDQLRRSGGARSSVAAPQKAAGTLIGNLSRRDQIEAAYDLHNPETKK